MTRYRTKAEIRMTVRFSRMEHDVTIPAHTRCRKITEGSTAGRFWVDDLSWIDAKAEPFLHHDATHRGIDLDPSQVEAIA
jgi:hypothetical protein